MTPAVIFLFPAILYGAAAAAAPVLIHLILRTKPRKIVFPAMRFVLKTHRSTLKMLRLKHLILLAMRMAAIVLAALLVARATIPAWASREDRSVPTAAAIVIDNTGSMTYRYRGQTLLALAKQQAQKLIESLPKGSRLAVVPMSGDRSATLLDPSLASQQVADLPATFNHASVAAALLNATEAIRKSDLPRKEVYLLSDLTATSWRDEVDLTKEKLVRYAILKCGGEDLNVMLGELKLSAATVSVGSEVRIETSLSSANIGGDMIVEVELDGEPVAQQTLRLPPGGSAPLAVAVRPKREGLVQGKVTLKNPDPLEMDNVRYFTLQVGPPAKVLILVGPTTVNQTGFLMGNAVAPGGAGTASASGIQRETISADQLDAGRLKGVRAVMLADVEALGETQWRLLESFVREGGALWVVAGPMMSATSYNSPPAQRLMPAVLGAMEDLPLPQHWTAADGGHPMLQPFEGASNPPLSDVLCQARFRMDSQAADARAIVEYPDKVPAILLRRLGEGRVLLWNFSPLPARSNLARLPQFTILAGHTAALLTAQPGSQTSYAYGQRIVIPIPKSFASPVIALTSPASKAPQPLLPDATQPAVTIPADLPGQYAVRFSEGPVNLDRGFSVNVEAAESDLRPVDAATLPAMFPEGLVIASDASEISQRRSVVSLPLDLTPALLVALLILLTAESFFANRFYRRADTPNPS